MLRGFFGNLIFAIIARMLCGNHLNKDKVTIQLVFGKLSKYTGRPLNVYDTTAALQNASLFKLLLSKKCIVF